MDKYLIEFFKSHSTLILPGFGALTITDESTGELLFMPYLKHNDGRFAQFIVETEGIDEQRAQVMVAQYVREIENRLNSEGNYVFYQFGTLTKKADGEISFDKEFKVAKNPEILEKPLVESTIVRDENVEKEILQDQSNIEESKNEGIVENVNTYSQEDQWNDDLELPPVGYQAPKSKQPILEKATPDKKKRRPIAGGILILGVLVIGAFLTYILFYNSFETSLSIAKNTRTTPEVKQEDTTTPSAESTKTPEPTDSVEVIEEKIENTEPIIESGGAYHLVVGAFKLQANAERFLQRVQEKGHTTASMHERYGLYLIHLNDFTTKQQAKEESLKNVNDFPGSWIYYYP